MKRYAITVNGQSYDVQVEELGGSSSPAAPTAVAAPRPAPAAAPVATTAVPPAAMASAGGSVVIKAPMPGTLMAYRVAMGQSVKKGDVVLILEAMKMENEIVAPADGSVVALRAAEGASVNTGDALVELG
ncbi:MAG: biotin/lipoyl-containing protein [Spirochaetota bacterium]